MGWEKRGEGVGWLGISLVWVVMQSNCEDHGFQLYDVPVNMLEVVKLCGYVYKLLTCYT